MLNCLPSAFRTFIVHDIPCWRRLCFLGLLTLAFFQSLEAQPKAASPAPQKQQQLTLGTRFPDGVGTMIERKTSKFGVAWVNLQIRDNRFVMYFLDKQMKVTRPDAEKVSILFFSTIGESDRYVDTLAAQKDGLSWVGQRFIKKPYLYRLRVDWVLLGNAPVLPYPNYSKTEEKKLEEKTGLLNFRQTD